MTFILTGKVGNEESYLLILAAKLSHTVYGVTIGISSFDILGKCTRGRQYVPGGRSSVVKELAYCTSSSVTRISHDPQT